LRFALSTRESSLVPMDEIQLWTTKDCSDAEDEEEVWSVVANDEIEYESGVYVCYPSVSGIRIPFGHC
jgi:hypothetical protein